MRRRGGCVRSSRSQTRISEVPHDALAATEKGRCGWRCLSLFGSDVVACSCARLLMRRRAYLPVGRLTLHLCCCACLCVRTHPRMCRPKKKFRILEKSEILKIRAAYLEEKGRSNINSRSGSRRAMKLLTPTSLSALSSKPSRPPRSCPPSPSFRPFASPMS